MATKTVLPSDDDQRQVHLVWASYFKWFLFAALLAGGATLAAYYLNSVQVLTLWQIKGIQILSVLPEAAALGGCGYNIQAWGGQSKAEKLNEKLFIILSSVGFFFIVFAYQLEVV